MVHSKERWVAECDACGRQSPTYEHKIYLMEYLREQGWIWDGEHAACTQCTNVYLTVHTMGNNLLFHPVNGEPTTPIEAIGGGK